LSIREGYTKRLVRFLLGVTAINLSLFRSTLENVRATPVFLHVLRRVAAGSCRQLRLAWPPTSAFLTPTRQKSAGFAAENAKLASEKAKLASEKAKLASENAQTESVWTPAMQLLMFTECLGAGL
jgi:hypothetical protein